MTVMVAARLEPRVRPAPQAQVALRAAQEPLGAQGLPAPLAPLGQRERPGQPALRERQALQAQRVRPAAEVTLVVTNRSMRVPTPPTPREPMRWAPGGAPHRPTRFSSAARLFQVGRRFVSRVFEPDAGSDCRKVPETM